MYKIDGEYLQRTSQLPVMHWQGRPTMPRIFSKQINGYHVSSDVMKERVCSQVNQEGCP